MAPPTCPAGGLLLTVEACAVCGTDAKIVAHGNRKVPVPQVLGHEVVGVVSASDAAVAVGTRVAVAPAVGCGHCRYCAAGRSNRCPDLRTIGYYWPGAFAELLAVPAAAVVNGNVHEVPAGLEAGAAALAEPAACCLNGQELAAVSAGDVVVVVGLGPIGWLHARIARLRGAAQVLLLETRPDRCERAAAAELGTLLPPDEVGAAVREATGGSGADVVIVAAPAAAVQQAALDWLAPGGRLSWFAGLPADSPPLRIESNQVHYGEFQIVGAHASTPAQNRRTMAWIAAGELRVDDLISARVPLAEAPAAVAATARGEGLKQIVVPR
ncbi:MAG: alcohol dehydrogenase catalytic domain-containing protein [Fimbriimonadaceae bacterium]|nr:alcohol dehydrogenase catalytic domain-containing protein [Fimbriimonadaceae bacterium]